MLAAAIFSAVSPDGKLSVDFSYSDESALCYSISYEGNGMVSPSPLGLVANFADFTRLTLKSQEISHKTVEYDMDRIKASHIRREANDIILHTVNPDGRLLDIEFMIFDNDVAFRYLVPKDSETGSIRVMDEKTSFRFPEGTVTYLTPQSDAVVGWKRTKPSYEEYYELAAPMDKKSAFGHGYTFPCLFKTAGGWALVSETGVDSRYCGCRLEDFDGQGYKIGFPMPEENNGNGTIEPAFALPGATAWRTITVGSSLAPIVETTIAFDVVTPKYEPRHRYETGKGTWSWILWQDPSINYPDQVKFIDLASAMGFKFSLVDSYWDENIGHDRIAELSAYAQSKNVSLFLWYASSGWWNDIVQGPVNVMSDPIRRKQEMRWMQSIGVKGIKVDFFGGDKQETIRLYEEILSDADDYGLMVIFHGCTLPRGWERMYPNYVGSEAVRASENLIFNQHDCDLEALNACLHPFIRNAVGSMEFGGAFLNKRMDKNNGRPDANGRVRGNIRRTTDAFELATAILFQNPVQNFALAPNNLEDAPAICLDFMKKVPTEWDETRLVDGMPGEFCILARRHGTTWYVGAISASDKPVHVDVKELEKRFGGKATVISTSNGEPVLSGAGKKPFVISANDGLAVTIEK